jgi:PAS domain-containing protein
MKIRTRMRISLIVSGVISLVVIVLMIINYYQVKGHVQYSTKMTDMAQKALTLRLLSSDYANAPNARIESQWQVVYDDISLEINQIRTDKFTGSGSSPFSSCNICHTLTGTQLNDKRGANEILSILDDIRRSFDQMRAARAKASTTNGEGAGSQQELLGTYSQTLNLYLQQLIDIIGEQAIHVNEQAMGMVQGSSLWVVLIVLLLVTSNNFILYKTNFYLVHSIARLKDGVEVVARGDLGFRIEHRQRDEFGDLVAGFNQMTVELHNVYGKYRNLFETMREGIIYQDKDGVMISMNPAAETILGKSIEASLGKT